MSNNNQIKLSEISVSYIIKYMLKEEFVILPITANMFEELFDLAFEYETELATKECNPSYIFDEDRAKASIKFVSEVSGITLFDKEVDLKDLNNRLETFCRKNKPITII